MIALYSLSAAASQGLTLSYSATTPETAPAFSIGFALPAFNSNLGTLDLIEFFYALTASGTVQVLNDGSEEFGGYGGQIMSINELRTPSNVGMGLSPEIIQSIIPLSAGIPPVGSSTASGNGGATGSVTTDPSKYFQWQAPGGGTLNFQLDANGAFWAGGGSPGISFGGVTMLESGLFTVNYTYTPVPEPTAVGLMLVGALVLLSSRQRRQTAP